MSTSPKANILLIGSGGSCDHGPLKEWKPSHITNHIPNTTTTRIKYDYIIITTKVIPDSPSNSPLIKPPLTPDNIILSGISMIDSHEIAPGVTEHSSADDLVIGAFPNPNLDVAIEQAAAARFVALYSASGKTRCVLTPDVAYSRWRKLIFNACLNSICLRGIWCETLVRPAINEIRAAAAAVGLDLSGYVCERAIGSYPETMYLPPSMLEDGNLIEVESIVGEPPRVGRAKRVSMPTLFVLYNLLKGVQWMTKEERGLIEVLAKRS
ncbi:hypothetical protein BDV23DRAFT_190377 [Aspergillus alliaceus]|uniref:Ketopantoate reductase C-terminal domain-containing protein n=1 Tax=Petromyces alliaceus TaxID=209559 RepID=A0A5N7BVR8_PETAA|nr:hypothetical protein BDV23DRAFT_190377 [Aspergillus alliaceus]